MLCRSKKAFVKALLPSSCAHFLFGPNAFNPCSANASTIPMESGTSGAHHSQVDFIFFCKVADSGNVFPFDSHKVWKECINCAKFPNCDEIAMLKKVRTNERKAGTL